MPYTVKTKDGLIIPGIPDDLPPDSAEVRAMVAKARQDRPSNRAMLDMVGTPAPPAPEPETTAAGLMGAVNRALLPAVPFVAGGAGAGALAGGVGAVPGAIAGLAAYGGARLVADPLVSSINGMLGTTYTLPTDALEHLMTQLGVPEPRTEAERIVATAAQTGVNAASGVGMGQSLMRTGMSQTAQGVGKILAAQPAAQIAGGVGSGAAAQGTAEAGGGPLGQFVAGMVGGMVAGAPFTKRLPRTGTVQEPAPVAQQAEAAAPLPAVQAAKPSAAASFEQVATQMSPEDVGSLVKKASGKGMGSATAKTQLAELAAVNQDAKAAADRLGIDLPPDVFSDSPQVRAAAGLTRSAAGSKAEGAWRSTVSNAVDKADEVIKGFDATFSEGQVSPGVVSEKVRDTMVKTRSTMNEEARKIYDQVDAAIPKNTSVRLPKVEETLLKLMDEVGEGGMSAQEKRLLKMVDSEDGVTYGRLLREKNLMGQALAGKESTYGNMEAGALKRLYGALAEDQLAAVESTGGQELRKQLHGANLLYAKERALGKRIVAAFGEDVEGSISNRMRAAITGSAKGGSEDFSKLMKVVPEDLRKETVATALAAATRSARGAERGGFGFDEFSKTYRGLRANAPVYKQVVAALGPESDKVLRDLYEISRRITDARANVLTTGKANQALAQSMTSEGLVSQILDSTVAKGVGAGVAAVGGGPMAAGATSVLMNALSNGKKDALTAAGDLFMSEEFKRLALEAATKPPSKAAVRGLVNGGAFKRFAKVAAVPTTEEQRIRWILNAIRAENVTQ